MLLTASVNQVRTGEFRFTKQRRDAALGFHQERLELLLFAGIGRHLDALLLEQVGERTTHIRRFLAGWGLAATSHLLLARHDQALQAGEVAEFLLGFRLLSAELKPGGGAKHLGRTAWILNAGQLHNDPVAAGGGDAGFRHAQAIHAALEDFLDRLQLLGLHLGDVTSWFDQQSQLAAAPQIKA